MPTVVPGIGTSVTAQDIITRAARSLGFLGALEVLSAAFANAGLEILNTMLDSWAGEFLSAYAQQEITFIMAAGKSAYTIGTVGTPDINQVRPLGITDAFVTDSNNLDYPVMIVQQEIWNDIGDKNINSQIPTTIFLDSQFPLSVINIFPVPLLPYSMTIDTLLQQATFALLTTQLSMPPGYARAYVFNLAIEMMGAGYPCLLDEKQLTALAKNASESKANIKRENIKEVVAEYDGAIVSKSYATYNIYSDGNSRS